MGGSAQWRVHGPQARSSAETHAICAANGKGAVGQVREGAWVIASTLPVCWGRPPHCSTAGKRHARTPPSRGVPHSGRHGDRNLDLHDSPTPSTHRGLLRQRGRLHVAWQTPSLIGSSRPGVLRHNVSNPTSPSSSEASEFAVLSRMRYAVEVVGLDKGAEVHVCYGVERRVGLWQQRWKPWWLQPRRSFPR